jgi:hypothetical protein
MEIALHRRKYFFDLIAILVLVSLIFWFARGMIWDAEVPFFRDLSTYFYPLRYTLWQAFKNGELPLWNRHFAMGFPVLADFQSGVFYPPHLLFLILPFLEAIRVAYIFHYLVAAIGTYILCRHWNYPRYQAMIGALLFTLGGTTVSLINLLNHFQSAVWLPWAVLVWERFLLRKSWRNFLLLVSVLVTQFLAGSPEIYALSMILLFLDGLTLGQAHSRSIYKSLAWLVAANLVVVAAVSIQLLPTLELILQSRRRESISYPEAASWSLNPWTLINLIFLDKSSDMSVGNGTQLFFDRDIPLLVSHYFGAIFFFGMIFWLHHSSWREKAALGTLIIASLVIAFGAFTPVYPFLYQHVSGLRTFRYPEKLFFFTQAVLLVATLRGLLSFQRQDLNRSNRVLLIVAFGCGFIFVLYVALRFNPVLLSEFIIWQKAIALPSHWTIGNVASVLVSLERQLVLLIGLLVLFFVEKNGYLRESVFKFLLVAIVFIDLSWAHQGYQYLLKPEPVLESPKILKKPDADSNRIFYYPSGKNLHAGGFVILRPPSTPFGEICSIVSSNLLPNAGVYDGFDYMQDINALAKESYLQFLRFANQIELKRQIRLLGTLNVKYVVSFRPVDAPGITLSRHFPQYPSWLYKIDRAVPRAYIVHHAQEEKNPSKILEYLSSDRFDPSTEVLLDEPFPSPLQNASRSEARIVKYGNQNVSIRTSSTSAGVLVLADSFYPGWHVYVDGKEEKLLRANYFFRAVAITTGEHIVEFKYEPYWFKIGRVISLLTFIILVIISIHVFLKTRRRVATAESRKVQMSSLLTSMVLRLISRTNSGCLGS